MVIMEWKCIGFMIPLKLKLRDLLSYNKLYNIAKSVAANGSIIVAAITHRVI